MNKSMHYLLQTKTLSGNDFSGELYEMDRNLKQKKQPLFCGRKMLLFFSLILFSLAGTAQNQTIITGTVTDSSGTNPLIGVTVAANASKKTTTTGANGSFSLTVTSADKRLTFSYVGMKTETKSLNGENNFTVRLVPDNTDLSEVVVVGYGTQKKESLTGAISTVTSKDIDRVHGGSTVSTTLAGKLPGVTYRDAEGRPGASASIQIRNMGEPLYVIDGIQQDEGQFNNLAPNDVESITILKDASAAIYGVRAANGVVVVTTKKGKTGTNNISINAYNGWQSYFRFPKVVNNTADFLYYKADAQINSNGFIQDPNTGALTGNTSITQDILDSAKVSKDPQYRTFDWRKFIFNNNGAPLNSVNININGGSDKVNYYVSGTNLFQNSELV